MEVAEMLSFRGCIILAERECYHKLLQNGVDF